MIDIEKELFSIVSSELREIYPSIFVTGEYVLSPSSFPAVSIVEESNAVRNSTISTSTNENYANVMYEVNVYSNLTKGKKTQCKDILSDIDSIMDRLGFVRAFCSPIPNLNDATIYRMVARYRAVVSKEQKIFRY